MLKLFKKNDWRRDTITEARGSSRGLSITLRNVPSLFDHESRERRFLSTDFGDSLLKELIENHLRPFEPVLNKLRSDGELRGICGGLLSGIEFSIRAKSVAGKRDRFELDLGAALLACFEAMGVKCS